jgi:hypothetical protein
MFGDGELPRRPAHGKPSVTGSFAEHAELPCVEPPSPVDDREAWLSALVPLAELRSTSAPATISQQLQHLGISSQQLSCSGTAFLHASVRQRRAPRAGRRHFFSLVSPE